MHQENKASITTLKQEAEEGRWARRGGKLQPECERPRVDHAVGSRVMSSDTL
jgi:hypothetical protein